jgi:hypothetical protein
LRFVFHYKREGKTETEELKSDFALLTVECFQGAYEVFTSTMRRNRSSFSFPDFSLRRLLLQGARVARGSPTLGNRCDIEKGTSSSSKGEKTSSTSSNKVSERGS